MAIEASGTPGQPPEEALVAAGRTDRAAMGKLFDRHLPGIYGFVARRIDDRDAVEAVTAATFERALGALGSDDLKPSFAGFLYRVAASAVVDHARRGRKSIPRNVRASDRDEAGDRAAAEAIADDTATRSFAIAIDRSRLRRGLIRLPEVDRRVLLLLYLDGLPVDEICAVLDCSRDALAVRLHHALRALRAELQQEAIDAA